ncbi:galactose oxidase [Pseudomonas phage D6]|nr:galactose oxidase [Pseudomonas phage D6]
MFELLLTPLTKLVRLWGNVAQLSGNIGTSVGSSDATVYGDNLYYAGGRTGAGVAQNTFRRFDLISRQWFTLANLPVATAGMRILAWDNKVYMFGGTTTSSTTYTDMLYVYDIATDTWSSLGSAPGGARVYHTGDVVDGKLYFFGGWRGAQLATAEVYDIATNTWSYLTSLPGIRHGLMCTAMNGRVYIFGGLSNGGSTTNQDIFYYSIADNNYVTLSPGTKPPVRAYSAMVNIYNRIYVYGGYVDGNGTASRNDLWEYNPSSNVWVQIPLTGFAIAARGAFGYAVWEGELHILSGRGIAAGQYQTDHLVIT